MITVASVGDLILDEPDPASFLAPSGALLSAADVTVGHVEVPHSTTTVQQSTDVPAPPADPAALTALAEAGFDVVTLAGNHINDAGAEGVADTVAHARRAGLATAGAGADLDEARTPAVVERGGLRIGVLSYNCVGPRESWATSRKAGCAYVHVLTHYELDHASPGGPPKIYTFADPDSLAALQDDVSRLRERADVVLVGLHKGVGHTPAAVAMYESPVARAAVDAGADAVFGHHAHIMRGIETYRGRPIFHGLGNFVTVTRALTPDASSRSSAELTAWARRRKELYGFAPDPGMPAYPFHPESRNTAIAVCRFDADGLVEAALEPCWIDDRGRPVPCGGTEEGRRVTDYIERITRTAGLNGRFVREDGRVLIELNTERAS
ncbi:CapA family protein [Streptomyces olivaceus]|uniref:CapA family protein n=1 Tax=Streptomyces olivaceus TaxID=47716 RepID=A0ABS7WE38_STROV|nr:CapA family protein [Streptomyces olivaceus]MBZ6092945.1 CapA family protein [Streptomyces olivaceus]MBZ6100016.1 CapA family protein [Streptomyces olivaceus]MBZ6121030.1 CapA family protein [Streptomyces olivaceus]MBZ6155778.1 CapA family protein [Streptomyces olivaceus]MBZ6302390.1 CapA family protein [Streptomyces olivaceus]